MFCSYPDKEQLQAIYGAYLTPILNRQLGRHAVWGNPAKVYALAGSMVQLYEQVKSGFQGGCSILSISIAFLNLMFMFSSPILL